MEFNPLVKEYHRIREVINEINLKRDKLTKELEWYDNTNVSQLTRKIDDYISLKRDKKNELNDVEKEIATNEQEVANIKINRKSILNPVNWFSKMQRDIRSECSRLEQRGIKKNNLKESIVNKILETDSSVSKVTSELNMYHHFDRDGIELNIVNLTDKLNSNLSEYEVIRKRKSEIDDKLNPIINEINNLESQKRNANKKIDKAEELNRELDRADNSYQRRIIHEKCEELFGEGSPSKIINNKKRLINGIDRNVAKLLKRAKLIEESSARKAAIQTIVIDGNNMCYEGRDFVKLKPLISVTTKLRSAYNIILVFDSSIRSMLRSNDKNIASHFMDNIKVHIVASKQLADETIIDIASNNDSFYILSNDRFGEYNDKEVVKKKRLIKHEIVNGQVLIHDLDINVSYG